MNLDDCTIYVFVRGDLKEEDQMVQASHAVFKMSQGVQWNSPTEGEPSIVFLDGGSSEKAIAKTLRKLDATLAPASIEVEPAPYNHYDAPPGASFVTMRQFKDVPRHFSYSDPDRPERGITAIATVPLTKKQAMPLANYRLRRYSPPVGSKSMRNP